MPQCEVVKPARKSVGDYYMTLDGDARQNVKPDGFIRIRNQPPTLTQVWLTTFEEMIDNPLGAIWVRPNDIRDAAKEPERRAFLEGPSI